MTNHIPPQARHFEFACTKEEIEDWMWHATLRSTEEARALLIRRIRNAAFMWLFTAACAVVLLIILPFGDLMWLASAIAVGPAALLGIKGLMQTTRNGADRTLRSMAKKIKLDPNEQADQLSSRSISIDDAGVSAESDGERLWSAWRRFSRIDHGELGLFLTYRNGNAIIIPNRVFVSDKDRSEFINEVRARLTPPTAIPVH